MDGRCFCTLDDRIAAARLVDAAIRGFHSLIRQGGDGSRAAIGGLDRECRRGRRCRSVGRRSVVWVGSRPMAPMNEAGGWPFYRDTIDG